MNQLLYCLIAFLCLGNSLAQNVDLPASQKSGGMPLMDALAKRSSGREFDSKELSLSQLSSLLWASIGVNRPDGKRTAPSAKDCQEVDIYVILKQGAYVYDAKSNRINLVVAEDLRNLAATQAFATNAPLDLVYVADQARMGTSSTEEKKTYGAIDVGYISQNAYLFCASEGLATVARASFDRKGLGLKLNLRPEQMIVLAQSVGYPKR
jgi:SagB-type dehydrogenase family enzyme